VFGFHLRSSRQVIDHYSGTIVICFLCAVRNCCARTGAWSHPIDPLRAEQDSTMHTPSGFTPLHVTPSALSETTLAFAFAGAKQKIRGDETSPVIPSLDDVVREMPAGVHHYLGQLQGADCIAIGLPDEAGAPPGFHFTGLRALFLKLPEATLALAARAFQVVEWDRTHRFCGRCGTPTRDKPGERAKQCPACGYVAYPRISPAMMVLVTRDREVLLARANRFPNAMYSALAGFVEPGGRSRIASIAKSARKSASTSPTCNTSPASRGHSRIR
jgi:NAD+ diphosphatase